MSSRVVRCRTFDCNHSFFDPLFSSAWFLKPFPSCVLDSYAYLFANLWKIEQIPKNMPSRAVLMFIFVDHKMILSIQNDVIFFGICYIFQSLLFAQLQTKAEGYCSKQKVLEYTPLVLPVIALTEKRWNETLCPFRLFGSPDGRSRSGQQRVWRKEGRERGVATNNGQRQVNLGRERQRTLNRIVEVAMEFPPFRGINLFQTQELMSEKFQ